MHIHAILLINNKKYRNYVEQIATWFYILQQQFLIKDSSGMQSSSINAVLVHKSLDSFSIKEECIY